MKKKPDQKIMEEIGRVLTQGMTPEQRARYENKRPTKEELERKWKLERRKPN